VSDERLSDTEVPMPTRTKIIVGLVGCVVVLAAGFLMLRVSSPAIRPDQVPPAGHYGLSCGVCHTVSPDARVFKVAR
jgi:hypothetical protein